MRQLFLFLTNVVAFNLHVIRSAAVLDKRGRRAAGESRDAAVQRAIRSGAAVTEKRCMCYASCVCVMKNECAKFIAQSLAAKTRSCPRLVREPVSWKKTPNTLLVRGPWRCDYYCTEIYTCPFCQPQMPPSTEAWHKPYNRRDWRKS